jgi:hypothetical protein
MTLTPGQPDASKPDAAAGAPTPPAADPNAALLAELEQLRKAKVESDKAETARKKAEQDKLDAEALKRGEHEKLLIDSKAKADRAQAEAEDLRFRLAMTTALAEAKFRPADGALEDVLQLFPRDGLKVGADGKIEGLDGKIEAFKKAKPHLFAGTEQPPAGGGMNGYPSGRTVPAKDPVGGYFNRAYAHAMPAKN